MSVSESEVQKKSRKPFFYLNQEYRPFKRASFYRFAHGDKTEISHTAEMNTSNFDKLAFKFSLQELDPKERATKLSIVGLPVVFRKRGMLVKRGLYSGNDEHFTPQALQELMNLRAAVSIPSSMDSSDEYLGFPRYDQLVQGRCIIDMFLGKDQTADFLIFEALDKFSMRGLSVRFSLIEREVVPPVFESVVFESPHL